MFVYAIRYIYNRNGKVESGIFEICHTEEADAIKAMFCDVEEIKKNLSADSIEEYKSGDGDHYDYYRIKDKTRKTTYEWFIDYLEVA